MPDARGGNATVMVYSTKHAKLRQLKTRCASWLISTPAPRAHTFLTPAPHDCMQISVPGQQSSKPQFGSQDKQLPAYLPALIQLLPLASGLLFLQPLLQPGDFRLNLTFLGFPLLLLQLMSVGSQQHVKSAAAGHQARLCSTSHEGAWCCMAHYRGYKAEGFCVGCWMDGMTPASISWENNNRQTTLWLLAQTATSAAYSNVTAVLLWHVSVPLGAACPAACSIKQ